MKILHTADWHLGTFRSPVKDGVNLRTEDRVFMYGRDDNQRKNRFGCND